MMATNLGSIRVVQYLLEQCQKAEKGIDAVDAMGFTAFTHAMLSKQGAVANLLLDYGADINIIDKVSSDATFAKCSLNLMNQLLL